MIVFILSMLLLSLGFQGSAVTDLPLFNTLNFSILFSMLQSAGSVMNVIVVPFLVCALLSLTLSHQAGIFLWSWNSFFVLGNFTAYLIPGIKWIMPILGAMQVLTIIIWLAVMIISLKKIKDQILKSSLVFFLSISSVFVIFLILDILISTIPIESLSLLDNFSMFFYFVGINTGSFFFAGRFLNKEAFVKEGAITERFISNYSLTVRETELVNELLKGKSNKTIGGELFISVKTVENHLHNIYRKADVNSRSQLIHLLHTWQHG